MPVQAIFAIVFVGSMGFDFGKRTELTIPVHERVAELLATLIRTTA
jgi:hypothetical protein